MAGEATARTNFIRDAQRFPMLEAAEERELVIRWRDDGDEAARERLVQSHLRLVIRIANQFRGYGRPVEDFISVGCIGLLEAIRRYDPDRGARLSTYATWWIRAAIQAEVMRSWSLVKIGTTVAEKKLFFGLRRAKGKAGVVDDRPLDDTISEKIADLLDVSPAAVAEMDRRLAQNDQSLNVTLDAESGTEWQDTLIDPAGTPETSYAVQEELEQRRGLLSVCLDRLNARERRIVTARRLSERPVTLRVLGAELGISCERVRQIEARAVEKLGHAIRKAATAGDDTVLRHAA